MVALEPGDPKGDVAEPGRVENGRLPEIAGLHTLAASRLLRKLCDHGLLVLHSAGSASYYTLPAAQRQLHFPIDDNYTSPSG